MCRVVCGSGWIGRTRDRSWVMSLVSALVAGLRLGCSVRWSQPHRAVGMVALLSGVGSVQRARARGCRHTVRAAVQDTPSYAPSASPTEVPSAAPTETPTETPSAVPTQAPSTEPSAAPTVAPSTEPSAGPTIGPSIAPSMDPVAELLTTAPISASSLPSLAPTPMPTDSPTDSPSSLPSLSPTEMPTTLSPTTTVRLKCEWLCAAFPRRDLMPPLRFGTTSFCVVFFRSRAVGYIVPF